ncbi:unnamed protein product [Cuscuta europaea]|uniref:Ubiquitin-like protease family profile domain-containing protein n=1 Tax=Cuscuta europaea TaxID=41803 RepID=A0A9P1E444_CUSEU|nr:unnamed protein product [Cuscuta europaea]
MDVLLKRPRYPSKYRVSPYTEPRASKRAKHIIEPSLEIHPIFIAETVEEWNELKDWIEGDDSQPPLNVVLMIPDEFEVNKGFFQDLVTCNLWLANYHQIMKKSEGNVKKYDDDKLLTKQDWRSFQRVLLPFNIDNKHWVLAEVDIQKKIGQGLRFLEDGQKHFLC